MANFKLLCTADLHLGRSSACLQRPEGVDVSATGAWKRMVDRAVAEKADAVVIAGDVFDSGGSLYEAREAFLRGLKCLEAAGIPTVAVTGNHDYEALRRFHVQHKCPSFLLLGLNGWEVQLLETKSGILRFAGWSFTRERETVSRLGELAPLDSQYTSIGIVHGDMAPNSQYHPLKVDDLNRLTDGWVLGHIHAPGKATAKWAYTGSPQALDFGPGERDLHGFRWMTIDDKGLKHSDVESASTVYFCETILEVTPQAGEKPWDAAIAAAEDRVRRIQNAHPSVESVQMRASVKFAPCADLPSLSDGVEPIEDGRHAVRFLDFSAAPAVDLESLQFGRNYVGELARLLIGVSTPRPNGGSWGGDLGLLMTECQAEIARLYRETLAKVQDDGDAAHRELSSEELQNLTVEQLQTGMFGMLSKAMTESGEAA